jgi:hypothetical protein
VDSAVQDIEHGHRHDVGLFASEVSVEGQLPRVCRCPGAGQAHAQDGIGTQLALVRRAVEVQHSPVHACLIQRVRSEDGLANGPVHIFNCLEDSLAPEPLLVAIAELQRFMHTGRCARGHCCTAESAVVQADLDLNGRVAARIKDLPRMH